MTEPVVITCKECKWSSDIFEKHGMNCVECRVSPPSTEGFPVINSDSWCTHHTPESNLTVEQEFFSMVVETFGVSAQLMVALEELFELGQAITKYERGVTKDAVNILEEVVDVSIMIEQIKVIYRLTDADVQTVKDMKIKRLQKIMEDEIKDD